MPHIIDPVNLTISLTEASKTSGFSRKLITRLRDTGEIETVEIAGRHWIARRSFENWYRRMKAHATGKRDPCGGDTAD